MQKKKISVLKVILSVISFILLVSIFLKAIFDMDTNYDVGWYHLPFAARIWGIIPAESFTSGDKVEFRYLGFPLLAHFFQGFLWKITGRVQAANLVGYFSVIIYLFFLKNYFKIPLYISTIAIFTIPAVLTHAPTGFVDLPGNIGVSIVVMMAFNFFKQSKLPSKKELLFTFLGAASAANIKPQLQPIIFILFWVIGIRLIWLYFKHTEKVQRKLWKTFPLTILASSLIFFTPIKNVVFYGNPFYPIKIEVAGIVLNHEMTPQTYNEGNRPQKWLRSIFEINTPDWSADQSNRTENPDFLDRAGGFFGAYVFFNLSILIVQAVKEKIDNIKQKTNKQIKANIALITVLLVSLIPANFPQSHELRYLMFWMISLVSLNLYLLFSKSEIINIWLHPKYLKLVYLSFFIVLCVKIKYFYLKPDFRSLEMYINKSTNVEFLDQISSNKVNCLVSRHGLESDNIIPIERVFYYNSYFHPDKPGYSIKVSDDIKKCENFNIVPKIN